MTSARRRLAIFEKFEGACWALLRGSGTAFWFGRRYFVYLNCWLVCCFPGYGSR